MKDLRSLIAEYEKNLPDEFVSVTREVDPKYEISAIIKKLNKGSTKFLFLKFLLLFLKIRLNPKIKELIDGSTISLIFLD